MIEVTRWWQEFNPSKPWLLVGKGPSFARRDEVDFGAFHVLAINHSIEKLERADVVSAIDLDVVRECGEAIEARTQFLLMPRYPHTNPNSAKFPPQKPLETFFDELPVLRRMSEQGRLVWYQLGTAPASARAAHEREGLPTIRTGMFSAEVLVGLLGELGARQIRSLGVDGGTRYAPSFAAREEHRLSNGQTDFGIQFQGIMERSQTLGIDYAPVIAEEPVRVFVGADESQLLGARVLEYSLRSRCGLKCEFDFMQNVHPPMPRDRKNQPRTQFSFRRFAIPKLAGYKGRAVYVDADMQVFRDFRELWELPFNGASVLYADSSDPNRPKQFSVLLLDCEQLTWDVDEIVRGLDEGRYDYDGLMKELSIEPPDRVRATIPPDWNSLEEYHEGRTGLIHYTDMPTQPWVSLKNRNGDLWVLELKRAIAAGFISRDEVLQAVRDGFARPSLKWQLQLPYKLWPAFKKFARVLDLSYRPHRTLQQRLAKAKASAPAQTTPSTA